MKDKEMKKKALDKMRKMKGMKQISVMADSEKGLKEGLDKAKDIIGGKFSDGGMKDPSPAEASKGSKYSEGGTRKYDRFADSDENDDKDEKKKSFLESLLSNPNKKKMERGSTKKTGKRSIADRINFGGDYSNGGLNDAYRHNKENTKKMNIKGGYPSMEKSDMHEDEVHSIKKEVLKKMMKRRKK